MLKQQLCVISLVVAGMTLAPLTASFADDGAGQWYGGLGFGLSQLEPDSNGSLYQVEDKSDAGIKLSLGYDWSDRISIEGYYTDLGEAAMSPNGTVSYQDLGASGLYYVYQEEAGQHRGWEAFLKAGLGWMKNDSDLPYERLHNSHVMIGLGGGYGFDNGLSLRADLDLYDKDSQFIILSLIKRFGQRTEPVKVAVPAPAAVAVMDVDSDGDGVTDSADTCPDTSARMPVDAAGCELVLDQDGDGVFDGDDLCPETVTGSQVNGVGCVTQILLRDVRFEHDKGELTNDSKARLDEVADSLDKRPDILGIQVIGHTDSRGPKAYNQHLSESRAKHVLEYLVARGIDAGKLTSIGLGESQPIADNATEEGRRLNRRVELKLATE